MLQDQIAQVKNKIDIVGLISEYLELKKAGKNFKTNCPFHGEKTPSFMVSPELQMFKCFGCGESGDVIAFMEKREGLDFGEALKYLADKAGIKLEYNKDAKPDLREKIIEINKDAHNFYQHFLLKDVGGKKILDYLTNQRGLGMEEIKLFGIGYSPDSFSYLRDYLIKKKKHDLKTLSVSGLFSGYNDRMFDKFKGRVIFPLFDHRDKVVGFSGRILPWDKKDTAKYINSPETAAYKKSNVLYGLNITKQEIRQKGFVVLVEGELDMISCYKAGLKNIVAIKGSALSEDQVRLLSRFCNKIIFFLDSDSAGHEAAKRGAIIAQNMGFEVMVAVIEDFKDPDEIARNNPQTLFKIIENSQGIWDFIINSSIQKHGLDSGSSKQKISQEVTPLLGLIEDRIVQSHYLDLLARKLSVPLISVEEEVRKSKTVKRGEDKNLYLKTSDKKDETKDKRILLEEEVFVGLLKSSPSQFEDAFLKSLFSYTPLKKIIDEIGEFLKSKKYFDSKLFLESLPFELKDYYSDLNFKYQDTSDVDKTIRELNIVYLKEKLVDLSNKIKTNEDNQEYLKEFRDLTKKLSTL